MNSEMELKVQAYLDNELTPGEARQMASLLTTDSAARDLYNELKEIKAAVSQNEPAVRLPESRDFYWSKIQREINRAESASEARPQPTAWWTRLLAPMAGAVALFAVLLSISGSRPGPVTLTSATQTEPTPPVGPMHEGEVLAPEMSAITFRSQADGVTVVWLSSDAPQASATSWFDWFE